MADILPQWVAMCHHGILSQPKLPRETELCPLFVLFRNYVEDPEKNSYLGSHLCYARNVDKYH